MSPQLGTSAGPGTIPGAYQQYNNNDMMGLGGIYRPPVAQGQTYQPPVYQAQRPTMGTAQGPSNIPGVPAPRPGPTASAGPANTPGVPASVPVQQGQAPYMPWGNSNWWGAGYNPLASYRPGWDNPNSGGQIAWQPTVAQPGGSYQQPAWYPNIYAAYQQPQQYAAQSWGGMGQSLPSWYPQNQQGGYNGYVPR
jgi:hypothetical protein